MERDLQKLLKKEDILNIKLMHKIDDIIANYTIIYYDLLMHYNNKAYKNGKTYIKNITELKKRINIISHNQLKN
jgi:hypothetical protein